jgi:predicted permease
MDMDDLQGAATDPFAMLSHFSTAAIVCSFIFTVIGIYLFRYGKKQLNYPIIFIAVAMMIYPMFTLTAGWFINLGIGASLCAFAYYFDQNANLTG